MAESRAKKPSETAVETRYLLMPNETNQYGTAFGGVVISWIDMTAAMAAQKHCHTEVVTASVDSLSFQKPIRIGDHVILRAMVNYAGKTSMEVGVQVLRENPLTDQAEIATTAHLTFVAIGKDHKPIAVPELIPETADEKRRYDNAKLRVKNRKELLKKMK
jgi:acyl-CoA hydrolase